MGGGIKDLADGLMTFANVPTVSLATNAASASFITGLDPSAIFSKAAKFVKTSASNALDAVGGGGDNITINQSDNSVQQSQTTAVNVPEPVRTNEDTVNAIKKAGE